MSTIKDRLGFNPNKSSKRTIKTRKYSVKPTRNCPCPDFYKEGEICLETSTYTLKYHMDNLCRSNRYSSCPYQIKKRVESFQEIPLTLDFEEPEENYPKTLDAATRSIPDYPIIRSRKTPIKVSRTNPLNQGISLDESARNSRSVHSFMHVLRKSDPPVFLGN
ncbi:MAG: hypothetical protein AABY22_28175 [Nanoarchaeota archaeon]